MEPVEVPIKVKIEITEAMLTPEAIDKLMEEMDKRFRFRYPKEEETPCA